MQPGSFHTVPDEELLNLLQRDNRMAFNELYERYWEKLYRAAYNVLSDEHTAKDIVQEIFLTVWRKRNTLEVRHFAAYLFQAVRFQVATHLRRGKLVQAHHAQLLVTTFINSTEELMNFTELNGIVENVLNRLPEKCRDVFYLSRFEHLTNSEIAERLNLSQRTVEWHISNALKHLRHSMSDIVALLLILHLLR